MTILLRILTFLAIVAIALCCYFTHQLIDDYLQSVGSQNKPQVIGGAGGVFTATPGIFYSPSNHFFTPNETAAQQRMPKGALSTLRVHVDTDSIPTSGAFTIMVRVNGQPTLLTCTLTGPGDCDSGASVSFADDSRVAIMVSHDLTDAGNINFTYTMLFN